ncbi:MAG: hypothetical protein CR954_00635 [Candidatus Moraniibacteriota bacterium]|nr:MAG: hypothetical protein CR954_00635 [Candidatus Moranbacteria bacterium]
MNIEFYHKNITSLGDATRAYVEEKLEALEKQTDIRDASVDIAQNKDGMFVMHVTVRAASGTEYNAEETQESVNACVDIIQDELRTQIRRDREKTRDLKRRGGRSLKKKMTIDTNARF